MEDSKAFTRPTIKPILKELVRTQVCFPNIQLLIDRIIIVDIGRHGDCTGAEAFRLYLSDGEKSIQALVKRRLYKMIVSKEIFEGSYLQIKEYTLAYARKINGQGSITYLILQDFYPIGDDGRLSQDDWTCRSPFKTHSGPAGNVNWHDENRSLPSSGFVEQGDLSIEQGASHAPEREMDRKTNVTAMQSPKFSEHRKRKRSAGNALGEIDSNLRSSPEKSARRRTESESRDDVRPRKARKAQDDEVLNWSGLKPTPLGSSPKQADTLAPFCISESLYRPEATNSRPITKAGGDLKPITTPLRLLPLSKLKGYPRRNDVYDVFAVIYSVSDMVVKRSKMPAKRDIRIIDPSTDKRVLLSVFIDPVNFRPAVGQIALMRNLTTHEWDGGMLNAYPKQCEGKEWFVPEPHATPGCNTEYLRKWWTKKVIEEQTKAAKDAEGHELRDNG